MTETTAELEASAVQPNDEAKRSATPLLDAARKVLMASIGAWALAADEIEDFVNRLVDRGEIAEKDGRRLVKDVLEKRREQGSVEHKLDQSMERFLARLNVPTKSDVEALNARIAELTQKIEELNES